MDKRKDLGQHFLHEKGVIQKIIDLAIPFDGHTVEVGPGEGALTDSLYEFVGSDLTLIEFDARRIDDLAQRYPDASLIEADAARVNYQDITSGDWQLVSNLPYNAAAAIVDAALSSPRPPKRLIVMVQKEQANRFLGREKSLLWLASNLRADVKKCFDVGKGSFSPPPKIDSTVLLFTVKQAPANFETILKLARAAFQKRRKQLRVSLKPLLGESVDSILQTANIDPKTRPQDLGLEEWKTLAESSAAENY
jgi:16S rRNA (adenine1518-N6/adenine1519-N6)-dimethyltransferase